MSLEPIEQVVACWDCEALLDESQRGFAFGQQGMLCWGCSLARGGQYDADQDRWTTAPRVADLLDPVEEAS